MRYNLLAVILLALSLALNFKPVEDSFIVASVKSAAFYILYPFDKILSVAFDEVNSASLFIVRAYGSQNKLREYERRIKLLQAEALLLNNLIDENENLRSALNFKSSSKYGVVAAKIISRDEKIWNNTILVDAGLDKGIRPGLTVISNKGLVGRVVEVSQNASKIMLITSPQSSSGIILTRGNIFGIAYGGFGRNLHLSYIPESASVEASDNVVVSSASSLYIPGIYIGKVSKVDKSIDNIFQRVEVLPETDFSKLDVVFICK